MAGLVRPAIPARLAERQEFAAMIRPVLARALLLAALAFPGVARATEVTTCRWW